MRKQTLLIGLIFITALSGLRAQIVLDHTSLKTAYLTKFHVSGYKFVEVNIPAMNLYVYNMNHSLFRTIPIPPQPYPVTGVYYLSENLFDLDPAMEFAVNTIDAGTTVARLKIYDETGSVVLARDSTFLSMQASTPIFENSSQIFFDGTVTRMKLPIGYYSTYLYYEYYILPGSIPCSDCSQGVVTGIAANSNDLKAAVPGFYPNPTSGYLKLKYEIPAGTKSASIKVYDMTGKLLQEMDVTNTFDNILLPPEFNNGMYLYSLIVDGVVVKNEKIVLIK